MNTKNLYNFIKSFEIFLLKQPMGFGCSNSTAGSPRVRMLPRLHASAIALLGCYAACVGSYLPTIRDMPSAPYSGAKQGKNGGKQMESLVETGCCGQGLFLEKVKEPIRLLKNGVTTKT
jgi:hypothetical protein